MPPQAPHETSKCLQARRQRRGRRVRMSLAVTSTTKARTAASTTWPSQSMSFLVRSSPFKPTMGGRARCARLPLSCTVWTSQGMPRSVSTRTIRSPHPISSKLRGPVRSVMAGESTRDPRRSALAVLCMGGGYIQPVLCMAILWVAILTLDFILCMTTSLCKASLCRVRCEHGWVCCCAFVSHGGCVGRGPMMGATCDSRKTLENFMSRGPVRVLTALVDLMDSTDATCSGTRTGLTTPRGVTSARTSTARRTFG